VRILISALCLPILLIHTHAGAADSSSWRFVQTAEPELNNLDDHKQPSSTLDPFNVVCRSIESAASAYDQPIVFLTRLIWQESRFDVGAVSPVGAQGWLSLCQERQSRPGLLIPLMQSRQSPSPPSFCEISRINSETSALPQPPITRVRNGYRTGSLAAAVCRKKLRPTSGL
jgi:hypothetical protein